MGKCASRDKSASSSRTPRFLFKRGAEKQQHQPAVSPDDHPKPSSSKEEEKVVTREEKVVEEKKPVVEASEGAAGLAPVIESKTEAEPVIPAPPPPSPPPAAPSPPSPHPPPAPTDDADIDTTITTFDEQDAINAYSGRITLLSGTESSSASSSAYNTANPSPARSFRSPDSAVYLSGSEDMPSYRASPAHPVSKLTQASSTDEDPFLARAGLKRRGSDEGGAMSAGFSDQRSGDDGAVKEPEVRSASPLQGEENWEIVSPKGLGPGEWVSVAKPEGQGSKEVAAPLVVGERDLQLSGQPVVETGGVASKAPVAGKSPEDEEADTVKSLGSDQSDEIETRSLTGDGGDYVLLGATEKGEKAGNTVDAAASEPTSSVAAGAITEVDPDSKSATPSDSQAVAKPVEPAPAPTLESQAPVVEQRSLPVESAPMEVAAPVESAPMEIAAPMESAPMEIAAPMESAPMEIAAPMESAPMEVAAPMESAPMEVPETQIEEKAKLPVEKASPAPLVEEVPTPTQEDKDDAPLVAAPAVDTPAMKELAVAREEAQDSPFPEEKAAVTPAPVIVEEVDPAPMTEEATPTPVAEDKVAAEAESTPEAPSLASETASEPASKTAPEPTSEPATEPASEPAPEPASEPAPEPAPEPASKTASETASAPELASEPASVPDPVPEPASELVSGPVPGPGPAPQAPVEETKPSSVDSSWRTFKEEIQSKSGTTTPSEAAPTA